MDAGSEISGPGGKPDVAASAAPVIAGLRGLHHVAFAVEDLDAAIELWTTMLGGVLELRRELPEQGVDAASIELTASSSLIELIAPLDASSSVQRFLDRRGAGLHHVAWEVEDVAAALAGLARAHVELIDAAPRPGLHGTPVAFLHPRSTGGVLTELVQAH